MPSRVEGVVLRLHFQLFIYVLNLVFQHDHVHSLDLFLSSVEGCICVSHNGIQPGTGVKYQVTI